MLIPRILTALVGIPIVIACIYYGGLAFYIMFFAVILFSVMEFYSVCKKYNPMNIMGTLVAIVFYLSLCTGTYIQETIIVSIFVLFFCLWVVVILVLAFSNMPRTDKFESRHPIPDGVEYSLPLDSESCSISAD